MFEKRQKEQEEDEKTEELTQPLLDPEPYAEHMADAEPDRNSSSGSINESRDLEADLPKLPQ